MAQKNKSKIVKIITLKCPECGEGEMFTNSAYNIKKFAIMHEKCTKCNLNFFPEIGFYYGAMYFSYAINVAIIITCGVGTGLLIGTINPLPVILAAMIPGLLLVPITLRLSRALMLHLFRKIK